MNAYNKNEPETIQKMFGSIAKNYDRTNAAMSLNLHRIWNRALVKAMLKLNSEPSPYLDLCCGTGEIAYRYLNFFAEKPRTYLLDFCGEMLECAKNNGIQKNLPLEKISFIQADAQEIPLLSDSIQCATVAYGIRNVKNPARCFSEVFRVLKPSGTFGILELTRPPNPILRLGHYAYLKTILPILGKMLTSNKDAYNYLCNSIHSFIPPAQLSQMLKNAGFVEIQQKNLMGGIATLLTVRKPVV